MVKVLFIAGAGQSGSTILDSVLGESEGFFSGGEIAFLPSYAAANLECSCGCLLSACPVWGGVLRRLGRGHISALEGLERETLRARSVLARMLPWRNSAMADSDRTGALHELYCTLAERTGSAVIVDSSKSGAYAAALAQVPDLEIYVVHLVRDPRPCIYSRMRRPLSPPGIPARYTGVFAGAAFWVLWNEMARRLRSDVPERYLRIRYEDFAANPRAVLLRILQFAEAPTQSRTIGDDGIVVLSPRHMFSANPVKLETGEVRIEPDLRWKRMRRKDRFLATALTFPFRRRYGV